jgi:hypothetical protein
MSVSPVSGLPVSLMRLPPMSAPRRSTAASRQETRDSRQENRRDERVSGLWSLRLLSPV